MKRNKFVSILTIFLFMFTIFSSKTTLHCQAENDTHAPPLIENNFESGTTESWGCLGSGTPSIDSNISYDGSSSLRITNRQQNWNGPSLIITNYLKPSTPYYFQGYVYHESTSAETFMWTMKWTDSEGSVLYEYINTVEVPPKKWTLIEGTLTSPPSEMKEILYYVESPNPALEFNIDSMKVFMADPADITTPSPDSTQINDINDIIIKDNLIMTNEFEDGTLENWMPMGEGKLLSSTDNSYSGKSSLMITKREAEWDGPSLDTTEYIMCNNIYTFSVYIYHEGVSEITFTMTEKWKNSNGNTSYTTISSVKVKPYTWTLLQGSISSPADCLASLLYIETDQGNAPFYIDNAEIYGKAPEKSESVSENTPVKQTTKEYIYDFEHDINGWTSRGESRIIRTNEYNHSGAYSLYISDRVETWNGAIKNIDFITRDLSYNYSMYIMYNGKEYDESHRFLLQLQYELEGATSYEVISTEVVKKNTWTKISGDFKAPKGARNVSLYVQSDHVENVEDATVSDLLSFYIDDVRVIVSDKLKKQNKTIILTIISVIVISLGIVALLFKNLIMKNKNIKTKLKNASVDYMTTVLNRNAYEEKLKYYKENTEECKKIFITVCDVNFLKLINDSYGHERGDEVIVRCAQILRKAINPKGDVFRTGGDEFICISTANNEKDIRRQLDIAEEQTIGCLFSVATGSAHYDAKLDGDTPDIEVIIKRADAEMYLNKEKIKSRIEKEMK